MCLLGLECDHLTLIDYLSLHTLQTDPFLLVLSSILFLLSDIRCQERKSNLKSIYIFALLLHY